MTTEETAKRYIVAYPHPKLPPKHHCCVCKIGSETSQEDLLDKLKVEYPDYAKDLGGASFYKASNPSLDNAFSTYNESHRPIISTKQRFTTIPSRKSMAGSVM